MSCRAKIPVLLAALCLVGSGAGAEEKKKVAEKAAPLSVPVPVDGTAEGVTVPMFSADGRKQMEFHMATATRPDAGHLEMTRLRLETFTETGASDMLIDMPVSVLDLETRIISSEKPVMIRRSDFEIVGEAMQFDSSARVAKITGKTRMIIFDTSGLTSASTPDE